MGEVQEDPARVLLAIGSRFAAGYRHRLVFAGSDDYEKIRLKTRHNPHADAVEAHGLFASRLGLTNAPALWDIPHGVEVELLPIKRVVREDNYRGGDRTDKPELFGWEGAKTCVVVVIRQALTPSLYVIINVEKES